MECRWFSGKVRKSNENQVDHSNLISFVFYFMVLGRYVSYRSLAAGC